MGDHQQRCRLLKDEERWRDRIGQLGENIEKYVSREVITQFALSYTIKDTTNFFHNLDQLEKLPDRSDDNIDLLYLKDYQEVKSQLVYLMWAMNNDRRAMTTIKPINRISSTPIFIYLLDFNYLLVC